MDSTPAGLATPYSLHVFEEVTSTQDVARELANRHHEQGPPVVVVAARQTAGRGRHSHTWDTAPRALAVSVCFLPDWPQASWPVIPLLAGLAAAEVTDARVLLKWPNDLLISGTKVGGVLVEAGGDRVVAGLGVNLWWPDPPPGRAGLHEADPGQGLHVEIGRRWADRLLGLLSIAPDRWARSDYLNRCATIGHRISWQPDGSGRAIGVDGGGALVVAMDDGSVRTLVAAEVRHLRPG